MKTFTVALVALVTLVLVATTVARKSLWAVKRETIVAAPPDVVFALASDARALDGWGWWHGTVQATAGGPPAGLGTSLTLEGDNRTSLTLSTLVPNQSARWNMSALRGGAQSLTVTLAAHPQGTLVSLQMEGTHSAADKVQALVMDVDRLVGRRLDDSLERLGAAAKALSVPPPEGL